MPEKAMKNFAQVMAIANGTLVSYLEPVKRGRSPHRGLKLADREIDGLAEELGIAWDLRWRTVYCEDLDAVQAAVKQAFHAQETALELEKKGIELHVLLEPGVAYSGGNTAFA